MLLRCGLSGKGGGREERSLQPRLLCAFVAALAIGGLLLVAAVPTGALAQQPPPALLTELELRIVGARLVVEPPALTVPKDIATFVTARIDAPDPAAIRGLTDGAAVLAELRGPEIAPTTIAAVPGEPLRLPPFRVTGDYFLDDIRLVKDGKTILAGSPPAVPIKVVPDLLVSRVTTRPLSLEEIRQRGIVIDESSFHVLEFQAQFVIDGAPVRVDFPVVLPNPPTVRVPGRAGGDFADALAQALSDTQRIPIVLPPELDRPGFDIVLIGAELVPVAPSGEELTLTIPPIPALIAIAGNVGFLNQFFSAVVIVENGAPFGSGLRVRDVRSTIRLPLGLDREAGTPDDPLRIARTAAGLRETVPVRGPGLDGTPGTPDDLPFLEPGDVGQGEHLIEGRLEGTHAFDIDLSAVLEGLPSGPVALKGAARGVVLVRNPSFALTLSHPDTVRQLEPYDLFATLTNTSASTANLLSVSLDPNLLSGAELLSEKTVRFETLRPGESATARFRLLSQRTGNVTFSQIVSEPGITASFALRGGVGERDVPLSPNALVLPTLTNRLDPALVQASQRVLGQALSISQAPLLPEGVLPIPRRLVFQRGRELADVGARAAFSEHPVRGLSDLLLDWTGNATADPGFDQLLRETEAGDAWTRALGAGLGAAIGAPGSALPTVSTVLDLQREVAEVAAAREPHISVAAGSPVLLRVTDALGRATGESPAPGSRARAIPFAHRFLLSEAAGAREDLIVVARPLSERYTIEVFGTGAGTADLGVVFPGGAPGALIQVTYTALPVAPGSRFRLVLSLASPGPLALEIDADGDGAFEASRLPDPGTPRAILDAPPTALAARHLVDFSEAFDARANSIFARFGVLVDVLLSRRVDRASAEDVAHYTIAEGNPVAAAALQPTGRIVTLFLSKPIGGLVPRSVTVRGLTDERGQAMAAERTLPIPSPLADGAKLIGQVRRADGRPVPRAFLFLQVKVGRYFYTVASFRADENGYFDVDFVRKADAFVVSAVDPATGESASVQSRVRTLGGTEVVNPTFFGRARLAGRILRPDGITPAGPAAVNFFPDYFRTGEVGKGVFSDANGTFAIEDVPLGRFTLRVETVEFRFVPETGRVVPFATGQSATVAGVVFRAGETTEVTVVLGVAPPAPPTGTVRGRVFFPGPNGERTPAAGLPVFLGSVARTETDETGSFEVAGLPPGPIDVVAVDPGSQRFAVASVQVVGDATVGVNLIFATTGAVRGRVVRSVGGQVQAVPDALVAGGFALVTAGPDGRFFIPEVPTGRQTIAAGDPVSKRTGSAPVDVFPGVEVEMGDILLKPAADITGVVRDAQGQLVAGALVRIPQPPFGYLKATTDADGVFVFPNLPLGTYLVSAQGRDVAAPLSPDEVATKLTADFNEAVASGNLAAIKAAFKQAVEVFVGTSNLLFQEAPASTPGTFGFVRNVRSFQDGIPARADIDYLPTAPVSGRTLDSEGRGTKAAMQAIGLRLDEFGSPGIGHQGFFESGTVTGEFSFPAIARGDYILKAARPFSPEILTHAGVIGDAVPDDQIVFRFPPPGETNGSLSGIVFLTDGVTPAGPGLRVRTGFGDLTVLTDAEGRFRTQPFSVLAGNYVVTVNDDPATPPEAQTHVRVPPGGNVDFALRLVGRTDVIVRVLRADGAAVEGAQVAVAGGGFPRDGAGGPTGPEGTVRFAGLAEDAYGVLATFDDVAGRAGFRIEQTDVLAGRVVEVTVTLRAFGTVTGTFLEADGVTPIASGQVSIRTSGAASAAATQTDAQGRFTFAIVPEGRFTVHGIDPRTRREGEATGRIEGQDDIEDIAVVTGALGRVEGRVLTADGLAPVPGAAVRVGSLPFINAAADGSFAFDGIPEGPFSVLAVDLTSGFQGTAAGTLAREGETVEVEVRLEGFGTVRGTVLDAQGMALAGEIAGVTIGNPGGGGVASSAVDADGRFELRFLRLGAYRLIARRGPLSPLDPLDSLDGGIAEATLAAHGEIADVEIPLRGTGSVTVRVFDADGTTLVGGADVTVLGQGPFAGSFQGATASVPGAPDFGTKSFPVMPVGDVVATVRSLDLNAGGVARATIAAPGDPITIDVTLGATGDIAGRLILPDAAATPVPGAFVTIEFTPQTGLGGTFQVLTDGQGAFAFSNIPVGAFRIEILEPVSRGRRTIRGEVTAAGLALGDVLLDLDAPRVVATDPPEGAIGVPEGAPIVLTFNEAIDEGSVLFDNDVGSARPGGNLVLTDDRGRKRAASMLEVSTDGRTVTITPLEEFESETRYFLIVRNGAGAIRDAAADRPVAEPFTLSFTSRDKVAPALLSQSPGAGAAGVLPEAVVRLTFSESMSPSASIALARGPGMVPVAGRPALLFGGTVLAFTPAAPLATNEVYTYAATGLADLAGNALPGGGAVVASFATLDTLGPTIAALDLEGTPSRKEGTEVSVLAVLADPDAVSVDFSVGGVPARTVVGAPFRFTFALPAGAASVEVAAVAVDAAGNRGARAARAIAVEPDLAPTVALSSPGGIAALSPGASATFDVAATDDLGVAEVIFSAVGAAGASVRRSVVPPETTRMESFDLLLPTETPSGGTVTVQAVAIDTRGQASAPAVLALAVRDGRPPVVAVVSPVEGALVLPGDTVAVRVSASDDGGLASISLDATARAQPPGTRSATETFAFPVPVGAAAGSAIDLTARADDTASPPNTASVVRRLRVADVTAPAVPALSRTGGGTRVIPGRQVTVRATTTDDVGVASFRFATEGAFAVEETVAVTPASTAQADFVFTVPLTAPLGQPLTVRARARDEAGNVSAEATLALATGDSTAPVVTIVRPASGTQVQAGTSFEVEVAATDDGEITSIAITASGAFSDTIARPVTPPRAAANEVFTVSVPPGATPGALAIEAAAEDAGNNLGLSAPRALTVVATGGTVEGVVSRAAGNGGGPAVGVDVTLVPPAGSARLATTDATGRYSFGALAIGTYALDFTLAATGDRAAAAFTIAGATDAVTRDVTLNGTGSVTVFVEDAQGQALAGAQVTVTSGTVFGDTRTATTQPPDGEATLSVLAGPFTASASDSGTGLQGSAMGTVDVGASESVTIRLEASGAVEGTVFAPDGLTGVDGAGVTLDGVTLAGDGFTRTATTANGGAFRFDPVPVGFYDLLARDGTGRIRAREPGGVTLAVNGEVVRRDLVFVGLGTVSGVVRDPSLATVEGASVVVQSQNATFGGFFGATTDSMGQYAVGGVPVGPFTATATSGATLRGEAFGRIDVDGQTVTVDIDLVDNAIALPANRLDANGFTFDIQGTAEVRSGTSSVFDDGTPDRGAAVLEIVAAGAPARLTAGTTGTVEEAGREIAVRRQGVAGLDVTRKVFVPRTGYLARYVEVLSNPTADPITVDVRILSSITGSTTPQAIATSSGDVVLDVTGAPGASGPDRWVVLDDGVDGDPFLFPFGSPAVAFVFDGAGAVERTGEGSLVSSGAVARLVYAWTGVTVPAGGTVAYLHFVVQQTSRAAARASAERLVQLPPEALAGLEPGEVAAIRNFAVPAGGTSALAPLPRLTGTVTGHVLASDGATPVSAARVRFRSDHPLFGRTHQVVADPNGAFEVLARFDDAFLPLAVPIDTFALEATDPATGVEARAAGGFAGTFTGSLTLGATAVASSALPGFGPEQAIDGDLGTSWAAAPLVVRVLQEGAPFSGSFAPLGTIEAFLSGKSAAEFYGYGGAAGPSASLPVDEPAPALVERRSQLFLVSGTGPDALSLFLIHGAATAANDGFASVFVEVAGDPDGAVRTVEDDPGVGGGDFYFGNNGTNGELPTTFTVDHFFAGETDGLVISRIDGGSTVDVTPSFLDLPGWTWSALSANGSGVPLSLEVNRTVRLEVPPGPTIPAIDVVLRAEATVSAVNLRGDRIFGSRDFTRGRVELLDAAGAVLFSEDVDLPGPDHDLDLDVDPDRAGVRRVRFAGLATEGTNAPALAEIDVLGSIPAPGGGVDQVNVDIVFTGTGVVRGRVTRGVFPRAPGDPAEAPVAGADVSLAGGNPPVNASTSTAADGTYTVAVVTPGTATVTAFFLVHPQGPFLFASATGAVAADTQNTIDVSFGPAGAVEGTVETAGGLAAVDVEVRLVSGFIVFTTRTDAMGRYAFADIPAGGYTVRAIDPVTQVPSATPVTVAADQTSSPPTLTLVTSGPVMVQVREPGGGAPGVVSVRLEDARGDTRFASTNANGDLTFQDVLVGPVTVLAFRSGFNSYAVATTTVGASGATVSVTRPALAAVEVTVSGAGGPVAGESIFLEDAFALFRFAGPTDADGKATFADVPEGRFLITLSGFPGYAVGAVTAVDHGQTVQVPVTTPPATGVVDGTVTDAGGVAGAPLAGVEVETVVTRPAGPVVVAGTATQAGGNGVYAVSDAVGGEVRVQASDVNSLAFGIAIGTLAPGGATTVDVRLGTAAPEFEFPLDQVGADGFLYRLDRDGSLARGGTADGRVDSGYFSQALRLEVSLRSFPFVSGPALLEEVGREVVLGPADLGGLFVTRKVFVPPAGKFARFLEVLQNPTSSPIVAPVVIRGFLAADIETVLVVDPAFTGRTFAVTEEDGASGRTTPALAFVLAGPNAPPPSATRFASGDATVLYRYDVTVPPGETRIVMHFSVQREPDDAAGAEAQARALVDLADPILGDPDALVGMSPEERAQVLNFASGP